MTSALRIACVTLVAITLIGLHVHAQELRFALHRERVALKSLHSDYAAAWQLIHHLRGTMAANGQDLPNPETAR